MPQMRNTITGKVNWMPDSYIGQFPFEVVEEVLAVEPVVEVVVEETVKKPRKRKAEYVSPTTDADGDGLVQDGTIFERPVDTFLSPEQVTAILAEDSE